MVKELITPLQRQAAQEYLTDLGLVGNIQTILNDLCRARPSDPYAFVLNRLSNGCIPATIHSLESKLVFGADTKIVAEVGLNCMYEARITPAGTSRMTPDDDDVNTSEGGTAEEHTSTTSKVIAELISSTFSELLIGINPSDQAAVDAALLSGATAEATAKEGAAAAAAAAVDGGGGASPPGEFSPEVEQQIKAENAIILATSCAALQASAFVTGAKAFVRAEVLRSPEAGPASVPQPVQSADNSVTPFLPRTCSRLAFPMFNCSDTGGKLKMRGAWITAPAGADRGESLGGGFGTDDAEAAAILAKVYFKVQENLSKKAPMAPDANGGFSIKCDKLESMLDPVEEAIKQVGAETSQVQIILDSGVPYNTEKAKFEMVAGGLKTAEEQVAVYAELVAKRPMVAGIIDPFPLEFPEAWAELKAAVGEACIVAGGKSCCNSVGKLTPAPPTDDSTAEEESGGSGSGGAEKPKPAAAGGAGGGGEGGGEGSEGDVVAAGPMGDAVTLSLAELKTLSGVGTEATAAHSAGIKILLDASAPGCPSDPTVMDFAAGIRADIVCIGGPLVAGGEMLNRLVDIADQIVANLDD